MDSIFSKGGKVFLYGGQYQLDSEIILNSTSELKAEFTCVKLLTIHSADTVREYARSRRFRSKTEDVIEDKTNFKYSRINPEKIQRTESKIKNYCN